MLGLVEWRAEGRSERVEEKRLGGVRFAAVSVLEVEGMRGRWSARQAAKRLARCGVRRAVFPREFPFLPVFAHYGIVPSDERLLRQAAIGEIVRCIMMQRGIEGERATAALCAQRVTESAASCAAALTARVRYLLLRIPDGGEELGRRLRFATGAAVPVQPSPEQLQEADILLCFDDSFEPVQPKGLVVRLEDPALRVVYQLPEDIAAGESDPAQLLSALYAADRISKEEIHILKVILPER